MPTLDRVILRGEGARVTATPNRLFRAEVSSRSLELLFRTGQISEELQERATEWIKIILSGAGIETDTQNDRESSTFTRLAVTNTLRRFRRQVAQGRATAAPNRIEQHLLDFETARLRHEVLRDRWWGPLARATLEELLEILREAVDRVKKSRGDRAALLALLDDVIRTAQEAPERKSEIMARRGRIDPNVYFVTINVESFWTKELGRRQDDLKGMVALADVVWRLLGQRKSPQAIREAFARHIERPV